MSLYEGIEGDKGSSTSISSKVNLSFLKSQLQAKKALLQNAAAAAQQQKTALPPTLPVLGEQGTSPLEPKYQHHYQQQLQQQKKNASFKLKPHRAVPLPLDSSGAFTIVPKALKEDKVFLFGEIMIEDEYNPTAPTDYANFKQKREQQKLKERIAKEIADRLARESAEEEEKRKRGAAIAPPSALLGSGGDELEEENREGEGNGEDDEKEEEEEENERKGGKKKKQKRGERNENNNNNDKISVHHRHDPKLTAQFGKGVSRGLGVAATIMSKMGYRDGSGLGAKEQGISRPLQVQRTGRNVGLIVSDELSSNSFSSFSASAGQSASAIELDAQMEEEDGSKQQESNGGGTGPVASITELLKSASKIVLLKNMVSPGELDAEFEPELREEMAKYGQLIAVVLHQVEKCSVDSEVAIRVFLEFSNQAQAIKAVVDLNGRFFGGRQLRALFYPLDAYLGKRFEEL